MMLALFTSISYNKMFLLYMSIEVAFISTFVITAEYLNPSWIFLHAVSCEIDTRICNHIADN